MNDPDKTGFGRGAATPLLWLDAYRSAELPDGPRASSYGCMGSMIRLPVDGLDILLYSNFDTDAVFNLSWLLNGRELPNLLDKRIEPK